MSTATEARKAEAQNGNEPAERPQGLWPKLAAVQAAAGQVEKTGHVSFGNTRFDHFQEHGLLAVLKPLLAEHKLVLLPDTEGFEKDGNHTIIHFKLTVLDSETGEQHAITFPNEGVDQSDKGFNKAYTGAMKYALQKLFLVPTDKVDEQEGSDESHNQPSTASGRRSASRSSARPTDKQIDYLGRLLRERPDVTADDAAVMQEWARERLSGGREGSCWELSERLKNGGERADAAIKDLAEQVAEWQRQQTDTPADTEGLFPPEDLT